MKQLPLEQLAKEFTDIASEQRVLEDKILRGYGMELFRNLSLVTPVDTGRARANWIVSVGSASESSNLEGEFSTSASMDTGITTMKSISADQEVFISNNLVYIARLNQGWSAQAPAAFVETTVDTITNAVPRIAMRLAKIG